jgi:hypothetical protein
MSDADPAAAASGRKCSQCDRPAHPCQSRVTLCAMHRRITYMRATAKRHGKVAPSREELESLAQDMQCVGCGQQMYWLRDQGVTKQATLQHDRDGKIRLLCLSCNSRHATHPGDIFYTIPQGSKYCPDCKQIKSASEFYLQHSRPPRRCTYCRSCTRSKRKIQYRNKVLGNAATR